MSEISIPTSMKKKATKKLNGKNWLKFCSVDGNTNEKFDRRWSENVSIPYRMPCERLLSMTSRDIFLVDLDGRRERKKFEYDTDKIIVKTALNQLTRLRANNNFDAIFFSFSFFFV